MRIHTIAILLMLAAAVPAFPADDLPVQPGVGAAVRDAFNPMAILGSAVGAGFTQATNTPSEWGQGAEGYGRRMGSSFAAHLVKVGIQYPLARLFHEEFGYQRSTKHGFKARLMYALVSTVYVRRTDTNRRTVSKSELGGTIGSGLLSRLWQPASVRSVSHGFVSAGVSLAADAGANVAREFWPEIRHPHHHAAPPIPTQAVRK